MAARHVAFSVPGAPEQVDEFICCSCLLAQHRSQLTRQAGAVCYGTECES
ncbi:DUF4193 family protein [Kocuria sabuli]